MSTSVVQNWETKFPVANQRHMLITPESKNWILDEILVCGGLPTDGATWHIKSDCILLKDSVVTGDVIVSNGANLVIEDGFSLDIDFVNHKLYVENGSGVLIKDGGKIH